MTHTETSVLNQLLDPVAQCLTPEVARKLIELRASPQLQDRLDALGDRCTEGQLTDEERADYETYVKAINFIAILQAKARKLLAAESVA